MAHCPNPPGLLPSSRGGGRQGEDVLRICCAVRGGGAGGGASQWVATWNHLPPLHARGGIPNPQEHCVGEYACGVQALPQLVRKIAASDQFSTYFGGLVSGHEAGRVGVCVFGEGLACIGDLHLVGDAPGALVAPK